MAIFVFKLKICLDIHIAQICLTYQYIYAKRIGMYIRITRRKNKDGSVTEYLQLARNEWDKQVGIPVRCWVISGELSDVVIVEQVKKKHSGIYHSSCKIETPPEYLQFQLT